MSLAAAEQVGDAVLFEGYALYPYRASAAKNRVRFQWGVLVPPAYTRQDPSEATSQRTECLMERVSDAALQVRARFLHLESRTLEVSTPGSGWQPVESIDVGDEVLVAWDEGCEERVDVAGAVAELMDETIERPFQLEAHDRTETLHLPDGRQGRARRRREPVTGTIRLRAEPLPGPYGVVKVVVEVENTTAGPDRYEGRDHALRWSMVGCHVAMSLDTGSFVSVLDPPEWARPYVGSCHSEGAYPVLVDEANRTLLSSPIILYDHPQIAPESPGSLYDSTEIDELLLLRTMTLTEEEKREARATDSRTASIIDQADHLPPEMMERLHGAIRFLGPAGRPHRPEEGTAPWWDPGSDQSVSPETDTVEIDGQAVARGSRVRLRPRIQGADAQDMFLDGRTARVEAVFADVDGGTHLAVTLEDDPAADLLGSHGRFRYFRTDEVEPLGEGR